MGPSLSLRGVSDKWFVAVCLLRAACHMQLLLKHLAEKSSPHKADLCRVPRDFPRLSNSPFRGCEAQSLPICCNKAYAMNLKHMRRTHFNPSRFTEPKPSSHPWAVSHPEPFPCRNLGTQRPERSLSFLEGSRLGFPL